MSNSNQPLDPAPPLSLQALAQAVAAAITEAQARIDAAQRADLERFIDENGRPRTLTVRLPGPDGEQVVDIPLLSFAAPTALRVTEATLEFEVDPADLIPAGEPGADLTPDGFAAVARIAPSADGRKPAKMTLRLEALPAPQAKA